MSLSKRHYLSTCSTQEDRMTEKLLTGTCLWGLRQVKAQTNQFSYTDKLDYQHFLCSKFISSVGNQNLVTLIFTITTFCQGGNTKRIANILSNSHSSRPIRTPLKSTNHASKYCIFDKLHYFGAHFTEIQGFAMKKMLKMS